jgi:hypothetical protein
MALANVSVTTSTFFEWLTRTNQLIVVANRLTEGQANSTGTLTLTNAGGVNGGVTLNIASGVIKGDAGLVTNVSTGALTTNSFSLVSNSSTITIVGGSDAELGDTIYLEIGSLSESVFDTSNANIASALSVSTAYDHANAAYNQANNAVTDYSPAFDQANTATALAGNANANAAAAFDKANTVNINAANASFMNTGTVLSARLSGAYTGITALGTITTVLTVANTISSTDGGFTFPNGNTVTNWTVSTSDPSGGTNGDVWIKVSS